MSSMRILGVFLTALALPFLAACGGSDGPGGAAEVVPADVALYAVVDTDFEGDQWETVQELAEKFPGGENLLQRLADAIEAEGEGELDFETDVRPALGPEVVFVLLELDPSSGEDPPLVVMTQPEDEQALQRLLDESDEPAVRRAVEDWEVVAEDEATLDRFASGLEGSRLADEEDFEDAMDGLEDDALVRLFVAAGAVRDVSGGDLGTGAGALDVFSPGGGAPAVGAIVSAEDEGARVDGRLVYGDSAEDSPFASEPYEAELPGEVPADVLAYVSFNDLERAISAFRDSLAENNPDVERQLGMAEGFLGLSLEEDIGPLFAGEGAVYVRGGALIPEITLVTRVEDEEQALATLDDLVGRIGLFLPTGQPERVDVDGVEVRELPISGPFSVGYAAFDGLLVVTTSREGVADLREEDDRLADDESFEEALDRADVPGETSGFAYVDLEETLPLVLGYAEAGLGTEASDARGYTEPLRNLVVWGTQEDASQRFSFFLGIE